MPIHVVINIFIIIIFALRKKPNSMFVRRSLSTVRFRVMGTGISEASKREFPFFPLLFREASKRVPIFDRGTRTKLHGSDPAAWSRA